MYLVICRKDEDGLLGEKPYGDYVTATRRLFPDKRAAEEYASTVAAGREPIIVADIELLLAYHNTCGEKKLPTTHPGVNPVASYTVENVAYPAHGRMEYTKPVWRLFVEGKYIDDYFSKDDAVRSGNSRTCKQFTGFPW